MGKKVHRGFLTYLLIFIGIVIAFFLVCGLIMIFSPGTKIFGLGYFKENKQVTITQVLVYDDQGNVVKDEEGKDKVVYLDTYNPERDRMDHLSPDTIEIESNVFDVNVDAQPSGANTFEQHNFYVTANTKGFFKGDYKKFSCSVKYFQSTRTLKIEAYAPEGFLGFGNSSVINLTFPYNTYGINLVVKSNKGNITLGGHKTVDTIPNSITAENVDLTTTSGNITTTEYFKIDSILDDTTKLKTGSGKINITTPMINGGLYVESDSGEIIINKATFRNTATFKTNLSFVHIGELKATEIDFQSSSGKIYADTLEGNIKFSDTANNVDFQASNIKGSLLIGTLNEPNISTKTKVVVNGKITGRADICTTGEVFIDEIGGETQIRNQSANVRINKVKANLTINTDTSKITLGKIDNEDKSVTHGIDAKVSVSAQKSDIEAYFSTVADGSELNTNSGTINAHIKGACVVNASAKDVYYSENGNSVRRDSPFSVTIKGGLASQLTLIAMSGRVNIYA